MHVIEVGRRQSNCIVTRLIKLVFFARSFAILRYLLPRKSSTDALSNA